MQAATVCNEQFPVLSYSVAVEGLDGSLLVNVSDNTTDITVTLSREDFPEFTVDQQYRVVINACTEFTCRRPPNPLIASTCCITQSLLPTNTVRNCFLYHESEQESEH